MNEGWIALHRKISDNDIWLSEPFTRGQAWVDLLLLANHEDGGFYLRDHWINIKRGFVGKSQIKLAERWQWSRTKLRKYLKHLEKRQQIIQHVSKSYSTIEIVNYNKYQLKKQQDGQQQNNSRTTEKQQQDTNNNDNKNNNDNNDNNVYFYKTENEFQNKIFEFEEYDSEMLESFYDHWRETDSNGVMRVNLEKFWNLEVRLKKWK